MSVILVSMNNATDIRIDKPILLIGRNDDCDVVVDSKKVSRQHCCIAKVKDYLIVRDLGSTNGIRVNGQRLTESKLVAGDELAIANLTYRVHCDAKGKSDPGPIQRKVTDSRIEEADEPIALAEPAAPIDSLRGLGTLEGDESVDAYPAASAGSHLHNVKSESSWLNIPDDVQLAPASDLDLPLKPFESQ
jgi:pSer/pThr/pTyr-binding forkhead associated (FHA) protein